MGLESKLGLHDAQLLPATCLPPDALGSGRPLVPVVAPSLYLQLCFLCPLGGFASGL